MAAAQRKSSIGTARRGIQKAHIPYRGDNPAVGKKTGIAVRNVERKSDGFEPFEEVMQQADKRTPPPLAKARKRKKSVVREEDHVDENGEMSMELDNSTHTYEPISQTLIIVNRSYAIFRKCKTGLYPKYQSGHVHVAHRDTDG